MKEVINKILQVCKGFMAFFNSMALLILMLGVVGAIVNLIKQGQIFPLVPVYSVLTVLIFYICIRINMMIIGSDQNGHQKP